MESKQKTLQQYSILRIIPPSDKKRKKLQKFSTVGSSFDLNVSSQGVKQLPPLKGQLKGPDNFFYKMLDMYSGIIVNKF